MDNRNQPAPGTATPPAAPRRGKGPVFVIAAVAVLLGLGAGILTGFLLFTDRSGDRTTANIHSACTALENATEDLPLEDLDDPLSHPAMWELMGAGPLLQAAGYADDDYAEIGEKGRDLLAAVNHMNTDDVDQLAEELLEEC